MNGQFRELQALCEAALEHRLTPEQAAQLEQWVLADPEARRVVVEYLHQNACLYWSVAEPAFLAGGVPGDRAGGGGMPADPEAGAIAARRPRPWRRFRRGGGWAAAAAVVLALVGWLGYGPRGQSGPRPVATLVWGKACTWGSGALPTEVGARLPAGRLSLAEGLARIVFADGAEVTLEAPAELELVSASRCILHAGRLVAKVPDRAIGFKVDTPTAVIEDLGTEFGVNVHRGDSPSADVQVFNGLVNVRHRGTGKVEPMRTGVNLRFAPGKVAAFDPLSERPTTGPSPSWADRGASRLIQISTATGRGKDAYIRQPVPMNDGPAAVLLVKNTIDAKWGRKAYLGFDLTPAAGMTIAEAQLTLALAPSGLGFASEVPDATFAVYGLTDESLDDWDEKTMLWKNAPANRSDGDELDESKVELLGRFEIVQGVLSGIRDVSTRALVDFLNRDTNGMATLIVVRQTKGSGRLDLVHGFAGKHHPQLPPPTLKLIATPAVGRAK